MIQALIGRLRCHCVFANAGNQSLGAMWVLAMLAASPFTASSIAFGQDSGECIQFERRLPPEGLRIPEDKRATWISRFQQLSDSRSGFSGDDASNWSADIGVLLKACEYALVHRELYHEQDFAKVDLLLDLAEKQLAAASAGEPNRFRTTKLHVRGFRSRLDRSYQPLGIVLPDELVGVADTSATKKLPLYVWLHGRGDKVTDLHFIAERLEKTGQIAPPGAIVVHPFGRQCIGYKSAGETDVMEAIDFVCTHYPVDERRIVLMGFSMGGAGVWHLAAHYPNRFVAASPGAGFAETARYQNLKPQNFPPKYEQVLWSVYDVPGYTRNLFNLPVVAYSGEEDKQIQAARVMEEAFQSEGRRLRHVIGPGMGHKYHPDSLEEIMQLLAGVVRAGKPLSPSQAFIQTQHWRYGRTSMGDHQISIDGMQQPYSDTRLDAKRASDGNLEIQTKNTTRVAISGLGKVVIDGQPFDLLDESENRFQADDAGSWSQVAQFPALRKRPGVSGPIDDAFLEPFLVVLPSGQSASSAVDRWVQCELELFQQRWQQVFRGKLIAKMDSQVTADDAAKYHLIVWGTPESNALIGEFFGPGNSQRPAKVGWSAETLSVGDQQFEAANHVPVLIYPNPKAPDRYLVFNSGPTFRPAHDRTNSLQNPHLPDWAVVSLDQPRSAEAPGGIAAAGFFDDGWQLDLDAMWGAQD